MDLGLVLFFGLVVLYSAYSLWLGRFSITMPMVFVFVGAVTGSHPLGWIAFDLLQQQRYTLNTPLMDHFGTFCGWRLLAMLLKMGIFCCLV
jgi:NhaP-type Na+/H+ and K+/H+ antiporter